MFSRVWSRESLEVVELVLDSVAFDGGSSSSGSGGGGGKLKVQD